MCVCGSLFYSVNEGCEPSFYPSQTTFSFSVCEILGRMMSTKYATVFQWLEELTQIYVWWLLCRWFVSRIMFCYVNLCLKSEVKWPLYLDIYHIIYHVNWRVHFLTLVIEIKASLDPTEFSRKNSIHCLYFFRSGAVLQSRIIL